MREAARLRQKEREEKMADIRRRMEEHTKQAEEERKERKKARMEKARKPKGNSEKDEKNLGCLLNGFAKTRSLINLVSTNSANVLKNIDFKEYYKCF